MKVNNLIKKKIKFKMYVGELMLMIIILVIEESLQFLYYIFILYGLELTNIPTISYEYKINLIKIST